MKNPMRIYWNFMVSLLHFLQPLHEKVAATV